MKVASDLIVKYAFSRKDFAFAAKGTVALFESESGDLITLQSIDGVYRMSLGEGDAILLKIDN